MTDCDHKNWEVTSDCPRTCGHCNDCGKDINIAILFDNLRKRMEKDDIYEAIELHEQHYHDVED